MIAPYDVMSVPGGADNGSNTAWFVVDRRRWPRKPGEFIGDGDDARRRAFAIARLRNSKEDK